MKRLYLLLFIAALFFSAQNVSGQSGTVYFDFIDLSGGTDGYDGVSQTIGTSCDIINRIEVTIISNNYDFTPYITQIVSPDGTTFNAGSSYTQGVTWSGNISEPSGSWTVYVYEPGSASGTLARVQFTYYYTATPDAVCKNITVQLDNSDNATIVAADVNSSSTCYTGLSIDKSSFTCLDIGANTVTLTATNSTSGTSDFCTSTVTVSESEPPVAICQNLTVQLDASGSATILPANVNNGSSDNCAIDYFTLSQSAFTCSNTGTPVPVTLTAYDESGNSDFCTASVTVEDNVDPVALCQNITVYLDASGSATASASNMDNGSTDACGIASLVLDKSDFDCGDIGPKTGIELTVTDNNSNQNTCNATVTVLDDTDPNALCIANINVELDATGNVSINSGDIDNGSNDNCGGVALAVLPMSFDCADTVSSNTVTLKVTDDSGNTATCTTSVTVEDNLPPVADCKNLTVALDENGDASITAADINDNSTDNCGVESISINITDFTCADLGGNSVVLTVTDYSGNEDNCTANVSVVDNLGIVAECHDTILYLDRNGSLNVPASFIDDGSWDNCIDETNFTMTLIPNSFSCSNIGIVDVQLTVYDGMGDSDVCGAKIDIRDSTAPEVYCAPITVELDGNGLYTLKDANVKAINVPDSTRDNCTSDADLAFWVLPNSYNCDDAANAFGGDVEVTLYARDLNNNTGTCETIVTVEDNQDPVAECKDITIYLDHDGDQTIAQDSVNDGSWDNCDITFATSQTVFDCGDECSNGGETCNIVTLTVTDQVGNFATCEATVTVRDTVLPDMECKDITIYLDEEGEVSIAHDSIDDGSWDACGILTYETDKVDFTCADECSNAWDDPCNIVTLTVTDKNGNFDQCTAEVTVLDTVTPEMLCHDITIDLADISTGNGLASITTDTIDIGSNDACGVESMWLSNYDYECDSVCTNIAGDNLAACPTVTLTVRDENFNTSTCTQTVTVRDNDAPHAECQDVTVYLDSTGYGKIVTINGTDSFPQIDDEISPSWDNCAIDEYSLDKTEFYCADIFELVSTHTVTLTIEDIHGNTSSCTSLVTVKDTVKPGVECQAVTISLSDLEGVTNSAGIIADPVIVADNNVLADWYDNCEVKFELDIDTFYCGDVGSNTVTITATDSAGNFNTCEAEVTVLDDSDPHLEVHDITVCLDGVTGDITVSTDTVDNGSWDNCGIESMWLDNDQFSCSDIGDNTVELTVRDVHDNTASKTAIVTVLDCTAPDVHCKPFIVSLYENGEYVLNEDDIREIAEGTVDNCTDFDKLVINITPKAFECIHVYNDTIPITVSATDSSGNTGTCITYVIVLDENAPVVVCKDVVDIYLDKNGSARIYPLLLNDGTVIPPGYARTFNGQAGGSYDACGIDSAWVSQTIFTCGVTESVEVELFMIDPSRNQSSCTSVVVLHDTLSPVIQPVADVEMVAEPGVCETEIDYPEILVSDNCETTLELTAGLGAAGMFPLGVTTETWVATDDAGNTTSISFDVTISTSNALPTIDALSDILLSEDTHSVIIPLSGISAGNDCDEQNVTVSVTATNPELGTSVVLTYVENDPIGSLEVLIAPEMSGTIKIEIDLEDSEGETFKEIFFINVGGENDAPFLVAPIPDQVVHASYVLKVPVSQELGIIFDDVDNSSLDIVVMAEGGGALPIWATIVEDSIVCTPTIADTGCVNIVITATDAGGLSVSDTFAVCVDGYPVSIGDLGMNKFEVQMYPNPTRGKVNMDISSGIYDVELSVMDITGKVVLQKKYSAAENITFDMSGKVSGMYFVKMNVDGNQVVKKLIVNKE